ncbi:hypothetical protein QR680_015123 [Steinernema hermaphroditum]|uniref:Uncharacterized protein n=1 Tax=Steinernema hermaphroditum TaxID=289476 RepID=A0AA39IB78_9BILA|nr:hypothetical protein QR680_015123 [Steinernema hermaphroditum]
MIIAPDMLIFAVSLILLSVCWAQSPTSNQLQQISNAPSSYTFHNYLNDYNFYLSRFHPHLPLLPTLPKPHKPPPGIIPDSFANQRVQTDGDNHYILDSAGNAIYLYCQTCGRGRR